MRRLLRSQSPQIGSSVQRLLLLLLLPCCWCCRNPLKSGQAFKAPSDGGRASTGRTRRNPLKSGQAFKESGRGGRTARDPVAIPSNRVKRSKVNRRLLAVNPDLGCRNPLKSGQAFKVDGALRSLKSERRVAIPSNRVKRSKPNTSPLSVSSLRRPVAIPSNRVKRSKIHVGGGAELPDTGVAIPSNRVKRSKLWPG